MFKSVIPLYTTKSINALSIVTAFKLTELKFLVNATIYNNEFLVK